MFAYQDPTGTGLLKAKGGLNGYQVAINGLYVNFARLPNSAFTLLEAFEGAGSQEATVNWLAYPRLANASDATIDAKRFRLQDEYVEWRIEKVGGKISRITFTTEFPDYFAALAEVGADALRAGIAEAIPGAAPSNAELFGPNFNPDAGTAEQRALAFINSLTRNPWNADDKGILVLSHPSNTLPALFGLVANCGVLAEAEGADAICQQAHGSCVPGRNSDPFVCEAAQTLVRGGNVLSLKDPAGVRISRLRGIWKLSGTQFDINDEAQNKGTWRISRNGRRAVLDLTGEQVTMVDDAIVAGAQVATTLEVGATLVFSPGANVPSWAQTGQESSRRIA